MSFTHGGDVYRQEIEYDFSVNINPLGMPLAAIRAAHEGVALSGRYPDVYGEKLTLAISRARNVEQNHIILGNGAAELIYMFCHAIKPAKALTVAPTFTEYKAAVNAAGGEMVYHMLPYEQVVSAPDNETEQEFLLTEDFLTQIDKSIQAVFLCNPNNPTGKLIEPLLMKKVMDKCEELGIYLLVDECFMPFVEKNDSYSIIGSGFNYREYPHVVILRAFTKIYAMAGLRLGAAINSDPDFLAKMRRQTQPWNVSIPAQMAGVEALKDTEYLDKTIDTLRMEKMYLFHELSKLPLGKIYKTSANYILVQAASDLKQKLLNKGILIRSCEDFTGLTGEHYRIAIRSHSENQALIRELNKILIESNR